MSSSKEINKIVSHVARYTNIVYPHRFPLAGGNCGVFAIGLSKFLEDYNIEHNIIILTHPIDESEEIMEQYDNLFDFLAEKGYPGFHILVEINDTLIDYNGCITFDDAYADMAPQIVGDVVFHTVKYKDIDYDSFINYVENFTHNRQKWSFFYEYLTHNSGIFNIDSIKQAS